MAERTQARMEKIRRVLGFRQRDLTLVLANIHDPHNVSAIYRSCDAFGVPYVHLYYTDNVFPAIQASSSASAMKWVESVRHRGPEELRTALKAQGMRIYASSCSPASVPASACDLAAPCAIILGNEHSGIAEELAGIAEAELHIPMYGMIQSFNVSVAAALILAEASRQRTAAGMYGRPSWNAEEMEDLARTWAQK